MSKKTILIKCKGNRAVPFNEFRNFQGNLKDLTKERATELMKQIKDLGWVAPVFVWNKTEILDGHQRLAVLPLLFKEGYTIGEIPVVDVEAQDKREAAKILLAINSRYGQITEEGLYEFMSIMDLEQIDLSGLELPEIDLEHFSEGYLNVLSPEEKEKTGEKNMKCPSCGYEF